MTLAPNRGGGISDRKDSDHYGRKPLGGLHGNKELQVLAVERHPSAGGVYSLVGPFGTGHLVEIGGCIAQPGPLWLFLQRAEYVIYPA